MTAWVLRQLRHPSSIEEFSDALAVVERMGNTLEFLSRSDHHAPKNDQLRIAIRNALTDYKEGPR